MKDYASGDDMILGTNSQFNSNRFNDANSSLFLNSGYCSVPAGVYFDGGDFTILLWVKVVATIWQELLDFGNTNLTNNVILQLDYNNCPNMQITDQSSQPYYWSSQPLVPNEWNHLAFVLSGYTLIMYLNGMNIAENTVSFKPVYAIRDSCFIGRSNWYWQPNNPDAIACLDEIKIFNRALSQTEIVTNMIQN